MHQLRIDMADAASAARVRELLRGEGFQVDGGDGAADLRVEGSGEAALRSRVDELERTLRELRNLDVLKSQYLANVSHELRTPLTAIVTYGEILRDGMLGELDPRQNDAIRSIIGSSRQLLAMIEDVLTYARTNARAIELEPCEFDLREVIGAVHDMNASLFRRKELTYEERIPGELPQALADRDKLLHVLGNLVGNAVEFTARGGWVQVEAARAQHDPRWITVTVADNGIGIDAEHHEMIFHEFAQVDSSRARQHHGTGLGLAIARNFVHLHGGEIWVESALGAGSRFCFTIPSVEVEEGVREDEPE
jgi:signal transduction histidine kinase